MIFIFLKPQYKIVIDRDAAASRQLAPEVIMVMFMSPLDAPRRGGDLWRFASLIPSGCRLPPIHKVMGDHASRGTTATGASAVTWFLQMVIAAIRCWKIAVSGPRNVVFGIFYVKN